MALPSPQPTLPTCPAQRNWIRHNPYCPSTVLFFVAHSMIYTEWKISTYWSACFGRRVPNSLIRSLILNLLLLSTEKKQKINFRWPGVDFSYEIFADSPCRPTFSPQICAIKLGIGERRKWIELSLWTSLSEKRMRNRPLNAGLVLVHNTNGSITQRPLFRFSTIKFKSNLDMTWITD